MGKASARRRPHATKKPSSLANRTFFHVEDLFEKLEKLYTPLGSLFPEQRQKLIAEGTISNKTSEDRILSKREEVKRVLDDIEAELKREGRSPVHLRERVWDILAAFLSPSDWSSVKLLTETNKSFLEAVNKEIKLRERLIRLAAKVSNPPLPEELQQRLKEDCRQPLDRLLKIQRNLDEAQQLLDQHKAVLRKKNKRATRSKSIRQAVVALLAVLTKAGFSHNRSAVWSHGLLDAWDPERAPASPESIRLGYK